MNPSVKTALIGAVATVLGALIGGGVTLYIEIKKIEIERVEKEAAYKQLERYRQRYEAAPKLFVKDLEDLIDKAPRRMKNGAQAEGADPGDVVVSARSIVASRDGLRSALEAIGSRLDSQIDELKDELNKPQPDPAKLLQTLQVLRAKWPSKKDEIDVAIRTVIAQFGLVPEIHESAPTAKGTPGNDVSSPQGPREVIVSSGINCDCDNTDAPNIGGAATRQCLESERNLKAAAAQHKLKLQIENGKIGSSSINLCDSVTAGPAAWPNVRAPAKSPSSN